MLRAPRAAGLHSMGRIAKLLLITAAITVAPRAYGQVTPDIPEAPPPKPPPTTEPEEEEADLPEEQPAPPPARSVAPNSAETKKPAEPEVKATTAKEEERPAA